jgi:hypothetical protein
VTAGVTDDQPAFIAADPDGNKTVYNPADITVTYPGGTAQ